jgi:type I restriction enzyme S subunit
MKALPDTGEPWPLPEGWVWMPLGMLGIWSGGGTPSKAVASYWTGGTIPWVSPKDMKFAIIKDTQDKITEKAVHDSATRFIPPKSVLMVMRSGILRHTFPVAVNQDRVTLNQDLRALSPFEGVDAEFLAHYLRLIQRVILHECSKDGTTVQSIEASALEKILVPIAPFPEQRRIVAQIDELFAEIAEGATALERARAGLDTWRCALLKAAVSGALTRDWRASRNPTETGAELLSRVADVRKLKWRASSQNKRKYRNPVAAKFFDPNNLPPSWAMASLDELTSGDRSAAYGVLQPGPNISGGVSMVRVGDIKRGRVNLTNLKRIAPDIARRYSRTRLFGREFLITLVGAIGRTAIAQPELAGANTARAAD